MGSIKSGLIAILTIGLLAGSSVGVGAQDAAASITEAEALAVNEAYFAAYEAGDVDAMQDLYTPDAGVVAPLGSIGREDWAQLYTWKLAEGTVMTPRDCTTSVSDSGTEVTIRCEYGQHEGLAQAVDGPVVPHTLTQVVSADGITSHRQSFGSPGFTVYAAPFDRWLKEHRPEAWPTLAFGNWSTLREATLHGLLTAQYADDWATYLEENGCGWDEAC